MCAPPPSVPIVLNRSHPVSLYHAVSLTAFYLLLLMIVAYIQHTLVKHLGGRMCSQPHCTTIGGVVWGGLYVCTELMQCFASLFSVNDMQEESGLGVRRHFKPESCTVVTLSAFAVAFLQTVSRQCCLLCQDGGFY